MLRTTLQPFALRRGATSQLPSQILRQQIRSTPFRNITQHAPSRANTRLQIPSSKPFSFSSRPYSVSRTLKSKPQPQALIQRLRTSIRHFTSSRARLVEKPVVESAGKTAGETVAEDTSLRGRLKKLSREYGWTVVGVYFALSVLDFPFFFLLVKAVGTERVGQWEDFVVSHVKALIPEKFKQTWRDWRKEARRKELEMTGDDDFSEGLEMASWGVEEADAANKRDASLATQLALAYAIHKSFIFIRVPLTAALTPKIVKTLRGWGWDIGKRTTKEAKALKRAAVEASKPK